MKIQLIILLIVFCLGLSSFGISAAQTKDLLILRVALYPYIPDTAGDNYATLLHYIEQEFENLHPQIDLHLRPLNQNDDFYDLDTLKNWLGVGYSGPEYDLVEMDAIFLGELADTGTISTLDGYKLDGSDWHPVGAEAVRYQNKTYGIPHLLCGHFVITRQQTIAKAQTLADLVTSLKGNKDIDLIGNFLGSFNMPALYLDSWKDTYPKKDLKSALTANLDEDVKKDFKVLTDLCNQGGKNPCKDKTYDDDENLAASIFSKGEADGLFGYSERLSVILPAIDDDDSIKLSSASFGKGNNPLLFVDAFVVRNASDAKVKAAAIEFAKFMNSLRAQETLVMSLDAPTGSTPRYLIPATKTALASQKISKDPYFAQIIPGLSNAAAYPNSGFLNIRKKMRDAILQVINP